MSIARAFTLFELLVTCTVIAVLAAMLLPTISLARKQAQMVVCVSNLRQIGTAAHSYANDYRSAIPDISTYINGTYLDWADLLSPYCDAADRFATPTGSRTVLWSCPRWLGHTDWIENKLTATRLGVGMNNAPLRTSYDYTSPNYWTHCNSTGSWGLGNYRTIRMPMISQPASRLFFCDSNDWHTYGTNATAPAVRLDSANHAFGQRHDVRTNVIFFDLHIQTIPLTRVVDALIGR